MYKHPYLQLLQVSVLLFAVFINVVPGNPATETEYPERELIYNLLLQAQQTKHPKTST
jgi:hypothetical protein